MRSTELDASDCVLGVFCWKALDEEGCMDGIGSMAFGLVVQKFLSIE
jgi:hypothetical protein